MEEFFWEDFFWENFFGRIFLGRISWEDFLEEFFGRNYLVEIKKELMFLSRFFSRFVGTRGEKNPNISHQRRSRFGPIAQRNILHFEQTTRLGHVRFGCFN